MGLSYRKESEGDASPSQHEQYSTKYIGAREISSSREDKPKSCGSVFRADINIFLKEYSDGNKSQGNPDTERACLDILAMRARANVWGDEIFHIWSCASQQLQVSIIQINGHIPDVP